VLLRSLCLTKESSKVCVGNDDVFVLHGVRADMRWRTCCLWGNRTQYGVDVNYVDGACRYSGDLAGFGSGVRGLHAGCLGLQAGCPDPPSPETGTSFLLSAAGGKAEASAQRWVSGLIQNVVCSRTKAGVAGGASECAELSLDLRHRPRWSAGRTRRLMGSWRTLGSEGTARAGDSGARRRRRCGGWRRTSKIDVMIRQACPAIAPGALALELHWLCAPAP